MSGDWKELASLESLMFRQIEIKNTRATLLEESRKNDYKIEQILRNNGMDQHIAKLDDNFEIKATIKQDRKKVFEKEKMADDMGVTPGATQKKDFLINKTEKGELTLDQFKKYFSWIPTVSLSVRKVKIKKPKKSKK
jgi:hypothetical protein